MTGLLILAGSVVLPVVGFIAWRWLDLHVLPRIRKTDER